MIEGRTGLQMIGDFETTLQAEMHARYRCAGFDELQFLSMRQRYAEQALQAYVVKLEQFWKKHQPEITGWTYNDLWSKQPCSK